MSDQTAASSTSNSMSGDTDTLSSEGSTDTSN
jgi:hypothetical protein